MSATANWSYTNVATVYPRVYDDWNNTWTNGTPYLIDCTWTANNEVAVDASGKEFTTNLIFFTELKRNGVTATCHSETGTSPEVTLRHYQIR